MPSSPQKEAGHSDPAWVREHHRTNPNEPIAYPVQHILGEVVHEALADLPHGRPIMHDGDELPGTFEHDDEPRPAVAVVQHPGRAGDLDPPPKTLVPAKCVLRCEGHEHADGRHGDGPAVREGVLLT